MSLPPAGWYPDPQSSAQQRWWDGSAWTMQTRATEDAATEDAAVEDAATEDAATEDAATEAVEQEPTFPEPIAEEHIAAQPITPEHIAEEPTVEPAADLPPYAADSAAGTFASSADMPATPAYPSASPIHPAAPFPAATYPAQTYPGAPPSAPAYAAPAYPSPGYGAPSYPGQEAALYGATAGAAYGTVAHAPAYAGYVGEPPIGVWRSPVDNRPLVTGLVDAVRVVLQKYAQFDGRASRSEFWFFFLASWLSLIVLFVLLLVPGVGILAGLALFVLGLGLLVPSLAVSIRRLRDAGQHWAWIFLYLVPSVGAIALIVLWCLPTKYP